ncbi:TELO2-interacting protein 1 homolog isoform X2 [Galleria mellonella]|uniref:TELO2-interacting protein 1 homolog isoform X2 n=1 Tax=Galleria mellonella TaxID=7137 RepID=A0ABM3MT78_GALME|nr:TELO2-interacting protein 1 homolog isoform X2 [Galleria mellonella]
MNADLKIAFSRIKPVCDVVMICPTSESIATFISSVSQLKREVVQELQQYLLFPFITHIKSTEIEKKYELQTRLIDAMRVVLEKVTVNNYEMLLKIETGLLHLVFENSQPGMIANVPEELKHSVVRALTVLIVNLDRRFREKLLRTQIPLLAQAIFVSVHMAKLEKLRALRLAAINCVTAHTATHPQLMNGKYHLYDTRMESTVVDMLSSILPGLLAALQDVATCTNNPGHAVVVASIDAIHRILCLTMQDKFLTKKNEVTVEDITKMVKEKTKLASGDNKEVSNKLSVTKRSPEWFAMAGERLVLITKSLQTLQTHEHYKVRKELAVYCSRILIECNRTMQPSVPIALDILIALAKDEYPLVSEYCSKAVDTYFNEGSEDAKMRIMDQLCDNFFATLNSLPSILNNIDDARKLSALNLLHGYVEALCSGEASQQRLGRALSGCSGLQRLCAALQAAATLHTDLALLNHRTATDVGWTSPGGVPWRRLRHVDAAGEARLRAVCGAVGGAACAALLLDALLDTLQQTRPPEVACLLNWMAAAPKSPIHLVKRILDAYLEEDMWYLPLEVTSTEAPITKDETLDVTVYNPRAWTKESVPGLFEGTVETRYTDISYQHQRTAKPTGGCHSLATAQQNMVLSCLLTEGVGVVAVRLREQYQPYMLKTLCLILERVGSKYEMLHLAGLKAINDIAHACGHATVAELIRCNADYFTNQVTLRLKKAWNSQSALQILSVVMKYSDVSMSDCLYSIVEDVLVQSCDKYYENNLYDYLQVFLTFVQCIRRWYPAETPNESDEDNVHSNINIFNDLKEYIKNEEESERLMSNDEFEKESGKTIEEMYQEDLKNKEDNILDYDDRVTEEKPPLPQHVTVTVTIINRCIHFISSKSRDEAMLALQIVKEGLQQLRSHEDQLLPLVHRSWAPLVATFAAQDIPCLTQALQLFLTLAELSKDFILSRAVKEVLPNIYKNLHKSSSESYLKDAGSAYRNSQAYSLQAATLATLPRLAVNLGLHDEHLDEAMNCVDVYLSKKQPKPLQALAVEFFKIILDYDYGAAWHHLRNLCNNSHVLNPPPTPHMSLQPVTGTPFNAKNKNYEANIKLIFNYNIS